MTVVIMRLLAAPPYPNFPHSWSLEDSRAHSRDALTRHIIGHVYNAEDTLCKSMPPPPFPA
eukprot:8136057-Pyramimonas_sp.AAC.1